ncbi:YcaO-like family protein [Geobacillus sp. TFV-3]|uniref:YcaO-like family protein n=1 Tax=Geobacillus sp. TFV-3 TaxID=1897059 RepID=UPI00135A6EFD|nr:YcaO-like family protein [Geobacillus sp. TFV-3]
MKVNKNEFLKVINKIKIKDWNQKALEQDKLIQGLERISALSFENKEKVEISILIDDDSLSSLLLTCFEEVGFIVKHIITIKPKENIDKILSNVQTEVISLFTCKRNHIFQDILTSFQRSKIKKMFVTHVFNGKILFGPYFVKDVYPCSICYLNRLKCNIPSFREISSKKNDVLILSSLSNSLFNVASGLTPIILNHVINNNIIGRVLIFDSQKLNIAVQDVSGVGRCTCYPNSDFIRGNKIVGQQCGLIKGIGPMKTYGRNPQLVYLSGTIVTNDKLIHGGAVDIDYNKAYTRTVSECIERFAYLNVIPSGVRYTSWREITNKHHTSLNLSDFNYFSEEQYHQENFRYKKLEMDTVCSWIKMINVKTGCREYVPANLILGKDMYENSLYGGPRWSSGTAAHQTYKQAFTSALLELYERDSITRQWISGGQFIEVNVRQGTSRDIRNACLAAGLNVKLYYVKNNLNIPVVLSVLSDEEFISFGCAAELNFKLACDKAILEASLMRIYIKEQLRQGKKHPAMNYLNQLPRFLVNAPIEDMSNIYFNEDLEISSLVRNLNCRIYVRDITPIQARQKGLCVLRMWSPDFIGFIKDNKYIPKRKLFKELDEIPPMPF